MRYKTKQRIVILIIDLSVNDKCNMQGMDKWRKSKKKYQSHENSYYQMKCMPANIRTDMIKDL